MADSNYTFKDATGTTNTHDARTEASNGEKRAVIVIGDPSVNAGVAEVMNSAPAGTEYGIVTREVNAAAQKTALEVIDDWDESDRAKVNPIVGQAGIAAGAGAVGATVPRVTLASDDPAVAKLGTIDTDTGNIADATGTAADAAATAGSTGTLSAKLRLITSQLDSIKTAVETLDNTVGGSEMQVDIVGALPAGTNAIGKLAANSGVDIGDVDVTSVIPGTGATNLGKAEDNGHTSGDVGVMPLGVRVDTPNATVAANGDYHYIATDLVGGVRTALQETDFAVLGTNHVKKYYTNAGAVTDGIIWSPAAGKRWYVTDIFINVSAAATVTLEDDKAGGDEVIWKAELAANSGWSHKFGTPLFSGEDAADLIITTSAGNVYVMVTGYEI